MDEDFDDGGGSPEDYGMDQADFNAASSIGEDTYNDNRGGDSSEDLNSSVENLTQKQAYTTGRGATASNPFPESFFSQLFGAENVDYTNILGGSDRINEINDLRYNQAIGGMSNRTGNQYQAGDYYIGQDTNMGTVKPIPSMGRDIMGFMPGGGILNSLTGQPGLPEFDPRYQEIMNKKALEDAEPTFMDGIKNAFGFGSNDSGKFGIPDNRKFDMFGSQVGAGPDMNMGMPLTLAQKEAQARARQSDADEKGLSGQSQGIGAFSPSNIPMSGYKGGPQQVFSTPGASGVSGNFSIGNSTPLGKDAINTARDQYSIPMSQTAERDPKFEGFLSDTAFPPSLTSSNQRIREAYKRSFPNSTLYS